MSPERVLDPTTHIVEAREIPPQAEAVFEANFFDFDSPMDLEIRTTSKAISILNQRPHRNRRKTQQIPQAQEILQLNDEAPKTKAASLLHFATEIVGLNDWHQLNPTFSSYLLTYVLSSRPERTRKQNGNHQYRDTEDTTDQFPIIESIKTLEQEQMCDLQGHMQRMYDNVFRFDNGPMAFFARFLEILYQIKSRQEIEDGINLLQNFYIPIFEAMNMQRAVTAAKTVIFKSEEPNLYMEYRKDLNPESLEQSKKKAFAVIYALLEQAIGDNLILSGREDLHREVDTYLHQNHNPDFASASQSYNNQHRSRQSNNVWIYGRSKSLASGYIKARNYQRRTSRSLSNIIETLPDRIGFTIVVTERVKEQLLELIQNIEESGFNIYQHPIEGEKRLEIISRKSGYQAIHWIFQFEDMLPVEIHIETYDQHLVNELLATHAAYKTGEIHIPYDNNQQFYNLELYFRQARIRLENDLKGHMNSKKKKKRNPCCTPNIDP